MSTLLELYTVARRAEQDASRLDASYKAGQVSRSRAATVGRNALEKHDALVAALKAADARGAADATEIAAERDALAAENAELRAKLRAEVKRLRRLVAGASCADAACLATIGDADTAARDAAGDTLCGTCAAALPVAERGAP